MVPLVTSVGPVSRLALSTTPQPGGPAATLDDPKYQPLEATVPLVISGGSVSRLALPTTQQPGGLAATLDDTKYQSLEARMPLSSSAYICQARSNCLWLLMQLARCPFSLAAARAGNNKAARIPMIAMTTSNSMRVNAC